MADKQTLEQSLREIDGHIVKVARELADAIDAGANCVDIDVNVGFLETLMRRRSVILSEYARAGGKVKDLNTFGAHVQKETACRQETVIS